MKSVIVLPTAMVSTALPLVSAYHIEPVKALWSGWALGDKNHGVSEIITCNFDSLAYVELFAGAACAATAQA